MKTYNRNGKTLLRALAAATLLTAGTGLIGCKRGGGEAGAGQAGSTPGSAAAAKNAAAENTPIKVTTAAVRREPITEIVQVTGTLSAKEDVTVGTKLAGKIVAVYFREGNRVRAGQTVAQQDPADARALLQQQQASLNQQFANLRSAQTRLQQARETYNNAVTTLSLTKTQTASAIKSAQASLEQSKEQYNVIKNGARTQEREQAQENVKSAKADRDKARSDLKRYQDLYRQQAIAAQQLDQAQATSDSADARYSSAVQALSLIQEGSRPEDIRRAQAGVDQAQQALVTAQSNQGQVTLRRTDVLNAQAGIQSAQAGIDQGNAAIKQAQAAVRLAQQALNDTTIASPIDGIIAERKAEPGQQLGAGKDVLRIVSLGTIYFDGQLSETQFSEVTVGKQVDVTVDALGGHKPYQGYVSKIFPVASATARSFTVRVEIPNKDGQLRPQMFARGQIVLNPNKRALVVSRDALLDANGNKARVFVVSGKQAKERKVTTGITQAGKVEILSGLSAGDQVVVIGQAQIQDGSPVDVEQPAQTTQQPSVDSGA